MTFTRLSRFSDGWSLRLDALAQQTASTLPYGERFKIGGDRLGFSVGAVPLIEACPGWRDAQPHHPP